MSEASWRWVTRLLDAAVEATGHGGAGREAMLAKLAELMFVEALRGHLDQLPPDARNWVAGLRDPQVGAALRLLHGRPAEPWTLERLAREVAMSRSSFAERFAAYVGVPPMQYLGRWRLQLAARMLTWDAVSVSQAASAVGYQSEAAFNRAFKREVGRRPAPGGAAPGRDVARAVGRRSVARGSRDEDARVAAAAVSDLCVSVRVLGGGPPGSVPVTRTRRIARGSAGGPGNERYRPCRACWLPSLTAHDGWRVGRG